MKQRSAQSVPSCPRKRKTTAKRQISGGSFILKGGGWYADAYSSQPKAKAPALAPPAAAPPPAAEPVEWSGKLDDVPPSRLIVATVKALVTNGVISEQAILDVLAKK